MILWVFEPWLGKRWNITEEFKSCPFYISDIYPKCKINRAASLSDRRTQTLPISKYYDKLRNVAPSQTKQLQSEGHSKRKIAKLLKMSRHTVNRYWDRTIFLTKVNHQKSNILDYEIIYTFFSVSNILFFSNKSISAFVK